jgi:hypothetical protein
MVRVRGWHTCLFAAAALPLLAGCTRISIHSNDGVEVRQYPGLSYVQVRATSGPVYVSTAGVGVIAGQRKVSVGWLHEQVAIFPDPSRCAALIVVTRPDDLRAVEEMLLHANHNLANVCMTGGQEYDE